MVMPHSITLPLAPNYPVGVINCQQSSPKLNCLRAQDFYDLASSGSRDQAELILKQDYGLWQTDPIWVEQAQTWLDLYYEDWQALEISAQILLQDRPQDSLGLYASALLSMRDKNYDLSLSYLEAFGRAEVPDEALLVLAERLEQQISRKTGECYFVPGLSAKASLDYTQAAGFYFYRFHQLLEAEPVAKDLFAGRVIDSYQDFETVLHVLKDQTPTLSAADLGAIMQWYFRFFMTFEVQTGSTVRSLDEAFKTKKYDCTEFTLALEKGFESLGIPSERVLYQNSIDGYHAVVAYQQDGHWGYLGPLTHVAPTFASLSDLAKSLEWDIVQGDVLIRDGKKTIATVSVR